MATFKWIADDVIQGRKFTEEGEAGPATIGRQNNSDNWFIVWCDGRVSLPYDRQQIANMLNRCACTPVEV